MILPDAQGWLLNRIAAGKGNDITIPHVNDPGDRTAHALEAMEQADLITVSHSPEGWRCAILRRGKHAIRQYRAQQAKRAIECV